MSIKNRVKKLERRQPKQAGEIRVVFHERALTPEEIRREGTPGSVTLDLTNGIPGTVYEH